MARRFPKPSSLTGKRSRLAALAASGALSVVGVLSSAGAGPAAAATLPAGSAAAHGPVPAVMSPAQAIDGFDQVRFSLGKIQLRYDMATAAAATPSGTPRQIAQAMLGQYGWPATQFSCLGPLWAKESDWSVTASNPGSGAYGIPQALPGSKMASAGAGWQTDAATQIRWGLDYIRSTYGSPCAAWDHEEADGWY